MNSTAKQPLRFSADGLMLSIEPIDSELRRVYEALIREDYERCHPGDTLEWLKHRARFSKEDQGLMYDWMIVAAKRARQER